MIDIELVENFDSLAGYESVWNDLLGGCEVNTIFQTYQWHQSWWRAFGDEYQTFILLAKKDGNLVGIAPLLKYRTKVLGRSETMISFIGSPTQSTDYCTFIYPRDDQTVLDSFFKFLLERRDWSLLNFSDIPSSSAQLQRICQFFEETTLFFNRRKLYDAPTRILSDRKADHKITRKKSLVRNYNYFKRTGEVELHHFDTKIKMEEILPQFFKQQFARRQFNNTPSPFAKQKYQLFANYLANSLITKGWLDFSALYLNNQPLAFHFGFRYYDTLTWYQPSFNPDYAKHGPGQVLLKLLIEYAIDNDLKEFDFTIGDEKYKYRFANLIRSNTQVQIYRSRISFLLQQGRNFLSKCRKLFNKGS